MKISSNSTMKIITRTFDGILIGQRLLNINKSYTHSIFSHGSCTKGMKFILIAGNIIKGEIESRFIVEPKLVI